MALFMPTNITPDARGSLGNGTVDATQPLTVSWQVNGNSAMTAFSITIYTNDTASTQVYTTGQLSDNCPFYGVDYNGNAKMFSYEIPATSGIANGNSYKLIIEQWWGSGDEDSVTQVSASAFITRAAPTLTLAAIPSPMLTRNYTFTATYEQAQGDSLNWVRWMIALQNDEGNPLLDTGNIYGTAELQVSYDGFFWDNTYVVQCMVQTENGVIVSTGWQSFSVSYATNPILGAITASGCAHRNAVLVSWPSVSYIPGTADGRYTVDSSGSLTLPEGSTVTWDQVNNLPMSFSPPWSIFYSGKILNTAANLFTIETENGNFVLGYQVQQRALILYFDGLGVVVENEVSQNTNVNLVITGSSVYVRIIKIGGGLYPGSTVYPSETLYPKADEVLNYRVNNYQITYTPSAITSVSIGGPQQCNYLVILNREATAQEIESAMNDTYQTDFNNDTYFVTDFGNSLSGGNIGTNGDNLVGLALYRRKGQEGTLLHMSDLALNEKQIYDYGAANQQGPYTYYIFPLGETTYITDPLISNAVTPCCWDWSVLDCTVRSDGSYQVNAEYRFGKNLNSGTITNNNNPGVYQNFTRYPTVLPSVVNYKSGALKSLIGIIDYANGNAYSDTKAMRDAIFDLSVSDNPMFLKSRKGDVMQIRPDGNVSLSIMDETPQQAQQITFSWSEINEAGDLPIFITPDNPLWNESVAN